MTINSKKNVAKHDSDTNILIHQEITKFINNGRLSCKSAFKIAAKLGVAADKVGATADLIDCKLTCCQLGLFGYKTKNNKTAINTFADPEMPEGLQETIMYAHINKKLTCKKCWEIASQFQTPKMTIGKLCNAVNIKITECQLGAF